MLLEKSEISVRPGMEAAFAEAMRERAMPILRGVPGVKWASFGAGVENPGQFLILAEWESLEAHVAFRGLPVYPEFGMIFAPFSTGGAMEHFTMEGALHG